MDPINMLTKRQRFVLAFIIDHISRWGYPPSVREICDHLGVRGTNTVTDHLKALVRKGYLEHHSAKSRGLRPLLTPQGEPFKDEATLARCPHCGKEVAS